MCLYSQFELEVSGHIYLVGQVASSCIDGFSVNIACVSYSMAALVKVTALTRPNLSFVSLRSKRYGLGEPHLDGEVEIVI